MKTESNNIFFVINSTELNREVAWEWKDQKKQFLRLGYQPRMILC